MASVAKPAREFGVRLRALREQRGLTMRELADAVAISYNYVRAIESGAKGAPAPDVLYRMADVLAVTVDTLLGRESGHEAADDAANLRRMLAILDDLEGIRPSVKAMLRADLEFAVPAIVSPGTWQAAQAALSANRGQSTRNAARPYLLRGLVVCAVCGCLCHAVPSGRGRCYYRCGSRERPSGPCGARAIPADAIEADVWRCIVAVIEHPAIVARMVETRDGARDNARAAEVAALERERDRLSAHAARLLARYRGSDVLPWDVIEREVAETSRARAGVERRLAALQAEDVARVGRIEQARALSDWCATVAANLATFTFEERRQAVELFGARVIGAGRSWRIEPAWLASCP